MKILFTITVIAAGIYLFIQQQGLDKLSQYLPQHQIEQNAERLITDVSQQVHKTVSQEVDEKIKLFKSELINKKDERINELEQQLTRLQMQFTALESQKHKTDEVNQASHQDSVSQQQVFLTEPAFAQTQYLSGEGKANSFLPKVEIATDKQKAIKRQANLQDIADRMNKTSLLALTH